MGSRLVRSREVYAKYGLAGTIEKIWRSLGDSIARLGLVGYLYDVWRRHRRPKSTAKGIAHLDVTLSEAILGLVITKDINRKMRRGFYRDRLCVVFGHPKSASRLVVRLFEKLMSEKQRIWAIKKLPYLPDDRTAILMDVSADLVKHYPQGGVLHTHSGPGHLTLVSLRTLQSKYAITMRHPVDQIAAKYCHISRMKAEIEEGIRTNGFVETAFYPVSPRYFLPGVEPSDAIEHLLRDGYLLHSLKWMTDWLFRRDPGASMIIRYENLVQQRAQTIDEMCRFINGTSCTSGTLGACMNEFEPSEFEEKKRSDSVSYPFGWSGKVGVWKDYLSQKNRATYLQVVEKFVELFPRSRLLYDVYPDLTDLDGWGENRSPGSYGEKRHTADRLRGESAVLRGTV